MHLPAACIKSALNRGAQLRHREAVSGLNTRLWGQLLLSLLLGGLMPFAFSPFDQQWLAVLALTGWLHLFTRGHAGFCGLAFGFGWFGLGAWWLIPTLHQYGAVAYPLALLAVACLGLVLACFPAVWAWLCCRLAGSSPWLLTIFPATAVGMEWLRGWLFTGLPWTPLGNLLLDTPAVGWGAYVGVYGATVIPVLLAASLFLLTRQHLSSGAAGLATGMLLLFLAPAPMSADGTVHRVALVQANIAQGQKWDAAFLNETMRRYVNASAEAAAHSDLVVWPEAAVPFFLSEAPGWDSWLSNRMRSWGLPVLFGGLKRLADSRQAHNGLYLFDPDSASRSFAGKQHLVPFGEYVPDWIPYLHALVPNIADFRSATDPGLLSARGVRYGSLVCYEAIFPEQARARVDRGAEVLVNVTNDAWYGHTPAAWQHLQSARMRAVETGRFLLRAANTGVSAIIAPDGRMTATVPWFTENIVYGEFRTSSRRTPYQRWGNWPLMLLLLPVFVRLWQRRAGRR